MYTFFIHHTVTTTWFDFLAFTGNQENFYLCGGGGTCSHIALNRRWVNCAIDTGEEKPPTNIVHIYPKD